MLTKNQIKYIQSLGQKKCRDNDNVFVAEGPRLVSELLNSNQCHVKQIYAIKDWMNSNPDLFHNLQTEVTEQELEKISGLKTPAQVLIVAEKIKWEKELTLENKITLVLDTIQDPGNMGTILRTADWFGIELVICSKDCADIYNPKVVQATMGSITRVRVEYNDLDIFLTENKNIRKYAAVTDGMDIKKLEPPREALIIIGNEANGISPGILERSDVRISVRGKGNAESLNAAIAAGIILSHLSN